LQAAIRAGKLGHLSLSALALRQWIGGFLVLLPWSECMKRMSLVVLASLLAIGSTGCGEDEAPPTPPTAVKVATVLQKDVPIPIEAIGQTRGSTEIEIRARVEGFVQTVDFKEGFPVTKGQLLYTIDPQPFEAALAQARGTLAQAEADLARAHQDVVRYEPLVAQNAISRQTYETAVAIERAAEAAVEDQPLRQDPPVSLRQRS
jgi:membrane fusion protein (multidrug efflux system)